MMTTLRLFLLCLPCLAFSHRRNVVFIVADDMRPWPAFSSPTGAVPSGMPSANTPHMDQFNSGAMRFANAYAQIAVCAPSRASFLTGRYPDTTRIWTIGPYFRAEMNKYDGDGAGDRLVTMPQFFLQNGYNSTGFGKVFHNGNASGDPGNASNPHDDLAYSWNMFDTSPGFPGSESCQICMLEKCQYTDYPGNYSWTDCPCADECFEDGAIAVAAEKRIGELASAWQTQSVPFFLAVGFHRPHLPFIAPSRFFDALPAVEDFPVSENGDIPKDSPAIASSHSWECRAYKDVKQALNDTDFKAAFSDRKAQELRRGYYAARSFVDHCIGRVLGALEANGLSDDTVVAIIGDHGWHLGEQGQWGKSTNWEHGTRVPLMVRAPQFPVGHGKVSHELAELVDVFPTLVELSGLSLPRIGEQPLLQGRSLASTLKGEAGTGRNASFSQYPNDPACMTTHASKDCEHGHGYPQINGRDAMGYTLRTDQWRFTLWTKFDWERLTPVWTEVIGKELYAHGHDVGIEFDQFEKENVASEAQHAALVEGFTKQIQMMQEEKSPVTGLFERVERFV